MHAPRAPHIRTIPSTDRAFEAHVDAVATAIEVEDPVALEARLRRLYPRVRVRVRGLAGESPTWYVYRDGAWRPEFDAPWWTDPRLPRIEATLDGWLVAASATARGLLGLRPTEPLDHYFTDFIVPGTLEDASALIEIIAGGSPLTATVRVRPATGDVIAVELRAWREGDRLLGVLRLAEDIEIEARPAAPDQPLAVEPPSDVVLASYARQLLARMAEPTPAELALRLRRLYPHAAVDDAGDHWLVMRDGRAHDDDGAWWSDGDLPTVSYSGDGLILGANEAATAFLGDDIVGRHWQELVTPGTDDQVGRIIDLIREHGGAVSRFRMPAADGTLVEFDSWTEVDEATETLKTVMRPAR